MKASKYTKILITAAILFLLFHLVIWHSITKYIYGFPEKTRVGDLARLSYDVQCRIPRDANNELPKRHIEFNVYENIDVLTIGTSVSNGGGWGKNRYYQDYIASNQNLKVMNIQPFSSGRIETILTLLNSGVMTKLNPRAIIIEMGEKQAIEKFARPIDWEENDTIKNITSNLYNRYKVKMLNIPFINNLNYNALIYSILYKFDDNAYFSQVYKTVMSKSLFSCNNPKKLLYYYAEKDNVSLATKTKIALLNDNLNQLQSLLYKQDIKLYFMLSVDKYNLYSKYIVNNPYKGSELFEKLRPLEKDYDFIDTKKILIEMTDNDIKDVFFSDDTHWSHLASEAIVNNFNFEQYIVR